MDKMLVKKEERSIIQLIGDWFLKIFSRKDRHIIQKNQQDNSNVLKNKIEKRDVLKLKEDYEKGNILEKDMTKEEVEELKVLYNKQNRELKEEIKSYNERLIFIRDSIIKLKAEI